VASTLRKTAGKYGGLRYLLFRPDDSRAPLPLITFLHGHGERGGEKASRRTLAKLTETGLPQLAAENGLPRVDGEAFPMMIVCPQARESWTPHHADVLGLVERLIEKGGADADRVYLTGLSIGALATWEIAARAPTRFAALVPVAGGVPPEAKATRDIPTWVFAAGADDRFSATAVEADLLEHRSEGVGFELSVIPGAGHNREFWNGVYSRSALYDWLLAQRR
jgi:predicted peptidase